MRAPAWVAVVAVVGAALVAAPAGPAGAQPVTVPGPDFDNDGFGDLAVGVPGEGVGDAAGAGVVAVLYGSGGGLASDGRVLVQGAGGVPGASERGDRFGAALVAGRFNTDGGNALAVGVPGEDVGAAADGGLVDVLFNSDTGLAGGARQQLTQADAAGVVESGDRFGAALSGPFLQESDVLEDLGIGAPGERVGGAAGAGAVSVLFSTGPDGLGGAGRQFLYQGAGGLAGAAEPSDTFAGALATTAG